MKELNINEVEQVGGGMAALSLGDAGLAEIALGVTAICVGAPFAAGLGMAIGIGMLFS